MTAEMIDLMTKASCSQPGTAYFKRLAESILSPNSNVHRSCDDTIFSGNAQASFCAGLFPILRNDLRVDEFYQLFLFSFRNIGFQNDNRLTKYTYLRCCKANASQAAQCDHCNGMSIAQNRPGDKARPGGFP